GVSGRHSEVSVFQRLLPVVLVLCSLAMPAHAQMVVVTGPGPGPARVESLLQLGGFTYRRLAPNGVTADALSGVRLVVLIQAPLSPAATAILARFAADGGKLVLINQEASQELYSAVGVGAAPAAPPTRYERIAAMPGEAL